MIKINKNKIFSLRTLKNISAFVFVSVIILSQLFLSPNVAQAATYTFSQTDWSGGSFGK